MEVKQLDPKFKPYALFLSGGFFFFKKIYFVCLLSKNLVSDI